MKLLCALTIVVGMNAIGATYAQVPGIINYQGRIVVNGANFNGTGQFKFALLNSDSTGTSNYWANDGTEFGQPASAVSLIVTKGLYSVLLGDTSIPNMSVTIAPTAFSRSDVRLRVWFNDGVSGFQQLSPDQRIASVGYALAVANIKAIGANTFVGEGAGNLVMSGYDNTANGAYALNSNTNGVENTATGYQALYSNKSGQDNTADGDGALFSNTSGNRNTAAGVGALFSNTNGDENTASGYRALQANINGYNNIAEGAYALFLNTSGTFNTAVGHSALYSNTNGVSNTAIGERALFSNTSGFDNTAIGDVALYSNRTGTDNAANGSGALGANTSGSGNTADGYVALAFNTNGNFNTATGFQALLSNMNGSYNIAIGYQAGYNLTTGDNNINIGNTGVAAEGNVIRIGTVGTQTNTYIAGISGVTISPAGAAVFVNSNGQLGTVNSSQRFKEAIQDMGSQSDVLLSLRPVAFRYKHDIDSQGLLQFGLIAEEVEKVAPELVLRDAKGEVYTVRYEQINAMLLNEFLKQHHHAQDQDRLISDQQKEIQTLSEQLAKLVTKIQQISQEVEQSKAPPLQAANAN